MKDINIMKWTLQTKLILEEINLCISKNNGRWTKQQIPTKTIKMKLKSDP